jgi:hypothetical protein
MWARFKCWMGWHDWNMYAGFPGHNQRVHHQAVCRNCKMTGDEYLRSLS